jgi:hypothetical protein
MEIVKIVTPLGHFTVGKDYVTQIIEAEDKYLVYKEDDPYNIGRRIEVKVKDILVYWD